MRIAELSLSNWLSLRDKTLDHLGRVQVATGDNGAGKTAILRAIQAAFRGAGPETITVGEERATVMVRLDDATTVRRTISRSAGAKGRGSVSVTTADGAKLASPQSYLSSLLGDGCFNPLALFLASDGAARREIVLGLAHVEATEADWRAWGLDDEQIKAVQEEGADMHPLVILEQAEKVMVERRRAANKAVVDAKAGVTAARPPDSERDEPPTVEEAEAAGATARQAVEDYEAAAGERRESVEAFAQYRADKTVAERAAATHDAERQRITDCAMEAETDVTASEAAAAECEAQALAAFGPQHEKRMTALRAELADLERLQETAAGLRVEAEGEVANASKPKICTVTRRERRKPRRRQGWKSPA